MNDDTLTLKADRQTFALILVQLKLHRDDLISAIATMIEKESNTFHHERELHLTEETIRKIEKVME